MSLAWDIVDVITAHDSNHPRSLQSEVGPSDLGQECDHCLAAKLAGWKRRPELAWMPYAGVAVHARLAEAFSAYPGEWLSEQPTPVGKVDGYEVWGTADLFHLPTRTVVDFKYVGLTRLRDVAAHGPSEQYRRQVHLYGGGLDADTVAICYLPNSLRPGQTLASALVYWEEPYDATLAYQTLKRADELAFIVRHVGFKELERLISELPRAEGCYDCPRFADWDTYSPPKEPIVGTLESLTGA